MDDDWTKIIPITELEAINALKNYFSKCGLIPVDIDHSNNKEKEQSPDLLVRTNVDDFFLCEIKTPGHYFDPIMNLYLWKNVYNRLRDRLRTARKQFENFDPL